MDLNDIVTPSAMLLIVIGAFWSNLFFVAEHEMVMWSHIGSVLLLSLWQIFLFTRLLQLADDAENDQEQFYAFLRNNASIFLYFFKGICFLLLWAMSFGALVVWGGDTEHGVEAQIASLIFGVTSLFMLVPLQKVVISPTYRE